MAIITGTNQVITQVPVPAIGYPVPGSVNQFQLSADGTKVVFALNNVGIFAGPMPGGPFTSLGVSGQFSLSPDGSLLAVTGGYGPGGAPGIGLFNVSTGAYLGLVDTNAAGVYPGTGGGGGPVFSPDGVHVALNSRGLVPGFVTEGGSWYLKNIQTGHVRPISTNAAGVAANANVQDITFSPDGGKVAFWTAATNLVDGVSGTVHQLYVKDLATEVVTRVTDDAVGLGLGTIFTVKPVFSPDGTKIAFVQVPNDPVPGGLGYGNTTEVYIKDLVSGSLTLASTNTSGAAATVHGATQPKFSPDGSLLYFVSDGLNLLDGANAGGVFVYSKNLLTGELIQVSTNANVSFRGTDQILDYAPVGDGSQVAFISTQAELIGGTGASIRNLLLADARAGYDNLAGTSGNDSYIATGGHDRFDGKGGVNSADYLGIPGIAAIEVTMDATGLAQASVRKYAPPAPGYAQNWQVDTLLNVQSFRGTDGADVFRGAQSGSSARTTSFAAMGGDDTIHAYGRASTVVDYAEADGPMTIRLQLSLDGLGRPVGSASGGTDGTDALHDVVALRGSAFNDSITGTMGNDSLWGGQGADRFTVTGGSDSIHDLGLGGADVLIVSAGASVTGYLAGDWTATSASSNAGRAVLRTNGFDADVTEATGPAGWRLDNRGNATGVALTGSAQADNLQGGGGADTLAGGLGNDSLLGDAGADLFRVTAGTDTISDLGGGDALVVSAGAGASAYLAASWTATSQSSNAGSAILRANGFDLDLTLATGTRGWTLTQAGMAGSARLTGSGLADSLTGGANGDTLDGGAGNDLLMGGAGDDLFRVTAGTDTISDLAGADALVVSAGATASASLAGAWTATAATANAGTASLRTKGFSVDLSAAMGPSGWVVSNADSGAGASLIGSAFADTLTGGTGADTLAGGDGVDRLAGGLGADRLSGGAGADRLSGGTGADAFVYDLASQGGDTITDFAAGEDDIVALAGGFGGGLTIGMDLELEGRFVKNLTGFADAARGQFIYETDTGRLFWDADGTGAGQRDLLAIISGKPDLVATDIIIA